MSNKTKSIIILILSATFVPELLTGSTNLFMFFIEPIRFPILLIAYGLAILLIREISVRYKMSLGGIFLMGLAYTIINEGLFAKTIIKYSNLPFNVFDNYGYIANISVPWTLWISLFHSVCSVLFPILLVRFLYPSEDSAVWLGKKTTAIFSFLVLGLGTGFFFDPQVIKGTPETWWLLMTILVGATLIAIKRYKNTEIPQPKTINSKIVYIGISTFFYVYVMALIAIWKWPTIIYILAFLLGMYVFIKILNKRYGISDKVILLFVSGCYIHVAITGILLSIFVVPQLIVERTFVELTAIACFVALIKKIINRHKNIHDVVL